MPKLPKANSFIDFSDYGRPAAKLIAGILKRTNVSPLHVTIGFIVSGILAAVFILKGYYFIAALFLILKSILDAADGELARLKNSPSYTGRYFDSIGDFIVNFLILLSIGHITDSELVYVILAFVCMVLQGTLYNYYYVILRNRFYGDTTSRIFELETPAALSGEKQRYVNIFFKIYRMLYGIFDKTIFILDKNAYKSTWFPKWFITLVSILGLGFQLLIISVMLILGLKEYIILFFIFYSVFIFIFTGVRKFYDKKIGGQIQRNFDQGLTHSK